MKLYIISIVGAAIISAVVNMLSPEKWSKYVGIVTGLVVVLCIGRPIFALMRTDVFSGLQFQAEEITADGERLFYDELKAELETRLEGDIKTRLKTEFGKDCTAEVDIITDSVGNIAGIKRITVYGEYIDNAAVGRLRSVYGASEVMIGGNSKVSQKTE